MSNASSERNAPLCAPFDPLKSAERCKWLVLVPVQGSDGAGVGRASADISPSHEPGTAVPTLPPVKTEPLEESPREPEIDQSEGARFGDSAAEQAEQIFIGDSQDQEEGLSPNRPVGLGAGAARAAVLAATRRGSFGSHMELRGLEKRVKERAGSHTELRGLETRVRERDASPAVVTGPERMDVQGKGPVGLGINAVRAAVMKATRAPSPAVSVKPEVQQAGLGIDAVRAAVLRATRGKAFSDTPGEGSKEAVRTASDLASTGVVKVGTMVAQTSMPADKRSSLSLASKSAGGDSGAVIGGRSRTPMSEMLSKQAASEAARKAALAASGEADSTDAHLSASEKKKAERLKRAKMFAAMLKGGEVLDESGGGSARGLGVSERPSSNVSGAFGAPSDGGGRAENADVRSDVALLEGLKGSGSSARGLGTLEQPGSNLSGAVRAASDAVRGDESAENGNPGVRAERKVDGADVSRGAQEAGAALVVSEQGQVAAWGGQETSAQGLREEGEIVEEGGTEEGDAVEGESGHMVGHLEEKHRTEEESGGRAETTGQKDETLGGGNEKEDNKRRHRRRRERGEGKEREREREGGRDLDKAMETGEDRSGRESRNEERRKRRKHRSREEERKQDELEEGEIVGDGGEASGDDRHVERSSRESDGDGKVKISGREKRRLPEENEDGGLERYWEDEKKRERGRGEGNKECGREHRRGAEAECGSREARKGKRARERSRSRSRDRGMKAESAGGEKLNGSVDGDGKADLLPSIQENAGQEIGNNVGVDPLQGRKEKDQIDVPDSLRAKVRAMLGLL